MRILISSNDLEWVYDAAKFVTLFVSRADTQFVLIGARREHGPEIQHDLHDVSKAIAQETACSTNVILYDGKLEDAFIQEARHGDYGMVVYGAPFRRRFGQLRVATTVRWLARYVRQPLLIMPQSEDRISRILACTGGDEPGEGTVRCAGEIARRTHASVVVLHVMSQIPITASAPDLPYTAQELIESGTREGIHFQRALDILRECGLPSEHCQPKVRDGLVIDEIIRELSEGDYQLAVIGAHRVPDDQSWHELRELLQEDISDRVLSQSRCPVLVVRSSHIE